MNIYKNELWINDLDVIIGRFPEIAKFENHNIFITGATGLICSAVIDVLIRWNETHEKNINIYAAGRNIKNITNRFGLYCKCSYFHVVEYDSTKNIIMPNKIDYIIHGASNASPNIIIKEPVETLMSNIFGVKKLLDYVRDNKAKRLLLISSSEVYGENKSSNPIRINNYGGIDVLNPRNAYSIGKCAAETLCASYYDEYGTDSVIVRPGHIYGPTAREGDMRVSSLWAYDVARGRDIIMKSDGQQIRSYCYCLDCASAILKVLLDGKKGSAYNISNPDSIISIRRLAEIMTLQTASNISYEIPSSDEKKGFNPMANSSLDSSELIEIGWEGLFDAITGVNHTVEIIKNIINNG
ncbi:NAD-dependent epimerase/dehydratase family protein [Pseudobutyrivibrio sp. MD2005]|uniref:NAD-dependent epimerase/dehydratase family protein n=1 Tax=Pseudobutyrivibrio sp. MD2005 TaxID=1410616 RepID=UPI000480DE64|nr:NAD-dependent epimerase/dehydratase family protein [Pseudobutyrivibrio sp. MD2005]